ncbi:MAG: hypothetical protein E7592_03820 [Ruminococcaceae bacterium]|nr:hypothetical protein [Oscillospiraceae bacterium]
MKIAVIYVTVGGTTRECAELLKKELKTHDVDLFDLSESDPELSGYDTIVVGFPIRMGRAMKKARNYIKTHLEKLKECRVAYYICCGFVDCFDEYAEKTIPDVLRERAVAVSCLGGSLEPSRFKGLDKLVVKAVRAEILGGGENGEQHRDMSLPTIMDENISQFADKIRSVQ